MANKQTSIDWLVEQLDIGLSENGLKSVINQAKEMHKQEIMKAYGDGRISVICEDNISYEQYYKDTYEK